jgi:hypothetical protein
MLWFGNRKILGLRFLQGARQVSQILILAAKPQNMGFSGSVKL